MPIKNYAATRNEILQSITLNDPSSKKVNKANIKELSQTQRQLLNKVLESKDGVNISKKEESNIKNLHDFLAGLNVEKPTYLRTSTTFKKIGRIYDNLLKGRVSSKNIKRKFDKAELSELKPVKAKKPSPLPPPANKDEKKIDTPPVHEDKPKTVTKKNKKKDADPKLKPQLDGILNQLKTSKAPSFSANECQTKLDLWNQKFDQIVAPYVNAKSNAAAKKANEKIRPVLRDHRIEHFAETRLRAWHGYYVGDKFIKLDQEKQNKMIANTMHHNNETLDISSIPNPNHKPTYHFVEEDVIELTKRLKEETGPDGQLRKPVALNFANAYMPGGGALHGSGAQEESMFHRSDYFLSLYSHPEMYPIDGADTIYTPGIQFFRHREENYRELKPGQTAKGYQYREPFEVNVIACAARKLGKDGVTSMSNETLAEYQAATIGKLEAVIKTAILHKEDTLVLGAFGCGDFKNPPDFIAQVFKDLLEGPYKGYFKEAYITVLYNKTMLDVFEDTFNAKAS